MSRFKLRQVVRGFQNGQRQLGRVCRDPELDVEFGNKPVPKDLDDYETKTGFKLPESYHGFLVAARPGRFVGEFNFASPRYPGRKRDMNLEQLGENYREPQTPSDLKDYSNDMDRALHLHIFCYSEGGLFFGWDPQEVTDPARHEYGVYELDRLYKGESDRWHVSRVRRGLHPGRRLPGRDRR